MTRTTVRETTVEYDEDGNVTKSVTTETTTEWDYSYVPVPQVPQTFGPYIQPLPYVYPGQTWCGSASSVQAYDPAKTYTVN